MFLGSGDIQLGVNESLYDTSVVISSMASGIVARVGPHVDIANLAKDSSVPVINALCDTYHPMQILAYFACIPQNLGHNLKGPKIAWAGDANNVLFDMCIGARKLGVDMSVATPQGYEIPKRISDLVEQTDGPGMLFKTNKPEGGGHYRHGYMGLNGAGGGEGEEVEGICRVPSDRRDGEKRWYS